MLTITNKLGEKITEWDSHKHPNNPNFMQVVRYMHIEYPDGRNNLYWRLYNSSANDTHLILNIKLADAKRIYTDNEPIEISEADFQQWLQSNLK